MVHRDSIARAAFQNNAAVDGHGKALLYTTNVLSVSSHDVCLTAGIIGFVFAWLALWLSLTVSQKVTSSVTRKVIHISCGPAYVLLWPYFTDASSACFVASTIPLLFIIVLVISGSAKNGERRGALGRSLSREGSPTEALQGPLYYSCVLLVITLLLFKSAVGAVAIMQLCFGDGAAEVFGRRFGTRTQWGLSWTGDKSIAGSVAFVVAAFWGSFAGIEWLHYNNLTALSVFDPLTMLQLAAISVGCAALELVPKDVVGDDNVTIAATSIFLSFVLFGSQALH